MIGIMSASGAGSSASPMDRPSYSGHIDVGLRGDHHFFDVHQFHLKRFSSDRSSIWDETFKEQR